MLRSWSRWCACLVLALLAVLVATPSYAVRADGPSTVIPLPTGTDVDYQLGGSAPVPGHVGIVVRDRTAQPARGKYDVCYVNGFQTQASERGFWRRHLGLVLQRDGKPVRDQVWDEWLLDIRTPARRQALARIVNRWSQGCARKGFEAVEFDNLDSFTRSHGLLTRSQATTFARMIVAGAHAAGLAAGQKNLSDLDGTRLGYDFAVAEECGRYDECGAYVKHYGDRVLAIEYRKQDFAATCAAYGDRLAVVLRDLDLSRGGVHQYC